MEGITSSGFRFQVDKEALNDMELLDFIADDSIPDAMKLPRLLGTILGAEQKKALYDHLRNEKGRVPLEAVEKAMQEIFAALGAQGKNS